MVDDGRVVEFVTLVLHHVHQLLIGQAVVDLVAWLVAVVEHLGCLANLLRSLAFGAGGVVIVPVLAPTRIYILLACVQLGQVLNCNGVFTGATPCVVHLLRAGAVINTLVCCGHGPTCTDIVKSFNAAVLLQSLAN